jgi:hypothetical protein
MFHTCVSAHELAVAALTMVEKSVPLPNVLTQGMIRSPCLIPFQAIALCEVER